MDTVDKAFLAALVDTASASGSEEKLSELLSKRLAPYVDEFRRDVIGNAYAVLNPTGLLRIMLAAHMDEIGFIVHYIDDRGMLWFKAIGGNDAGIAVGQRVRVGTGAVVGVIGRKAVHLQDRGDTAKPQLSDLWIDIGAGSREEAETQVELGDLAVVDSTLQELAGKRVCGRAFDNKAGLYVLAEVMRLLSEDTFFRNQTSVSVHAVATVQEEIGARGASAAAFALQPEVGIVIDVGQALDYPHIRASEHGEFFLGRGPGIVVGPNAHPAIHGLLRRVAEEALIPFQISVTPGVSPTDANALQTAGSGVATGIIELPLRYMHTPSEVIDTDDLSAAANLLVAFCAKFAREPALIRQFLKEGYDGCPSTRELAR